VFFFFFLNTHPLFESVQGVGTNIREEQRWWNIGL